MHTLEERAQQIKIIFFDIDDTLRVKTTAYMPESITRAFEKLRARGILTGIATGRNFYGVVPEVRALKPDFFVTINGAYVEGPDQEVVYQRPFARDLVEDIVAWLESEHSDYAFVGSHDLRVSNWNDTVSEAITPIYQRLEEDASFYQREEVYQMLTLAADDTQRVLPPHLAERIRLVRWHPFSSDIIQMGGSKAIGVAKILERLHLSPSQLMNFGDELNDRELFDYAGLSVAMKVSHPDILAMADYVAESIEDDGVYKALVRLGLIDD